MHTLCQVKYIIKIKSPFYLKSINVAIKTFNITQVDHFIFLLDWTEQC